MPWFGGCSEVPQFGHCSRQFFSCDNDVLVLYCSILANSYSIICLRPSTSYSHALLLNLSISDTPFVTLRPKDFNRQWYNNVVAERDLTDSLLLSLFFVGLMAVHGATY